MSLKFDFTTASREELKFAWETIAKEIGDDMFFTSKELDALPSILAPCEQVLAYCSGLHESNTWLIVLTDQRIILMDKGIIFGLTQSSVELDRINSIESTVGIMFGEISIGSNAKNYRITNVWKKVVNPFTLKVREARAAYERGQPMYTPAYPAIAAPSEAAPPASRAPELQPATFAPERPAETPQAGNAPEDSGAMTDHQIRMEKAGLNWRRSDAP